MHKAMLLAVLYFGYPIVSGVTAFRSTSRFGNEPHIILFVAGGTVELITAALFVGMFNSVHWLWFCTFFLMHTLGYGLYLRYTEALQRLDE